MANQPPSVNHPEPEWQDARSGTMDQSILRAINNSWIQQADAAIKMKLTTGSNTNQIITQGGYTSGSTWTSPAVTTAPQIHPGMYVQDLHTLLPKPPKFDTPEDAQRWLDNYPLG